MIVTLDGERLNLSISPDGTLQALIDRVRETQPESRLIVSVAVDGEAVVDQRLNERLESPLGGVTQVDLGSADRRELVHEVLCDVADRLGDVGGAQAAVAGELHSGNVPEAIHRFQEFLEAWQLCQRSILDCSGLLGHDLTTIECEGKPVRQHLNGLADRLRELRDAFEARDNVLLADLIQYEIPGTCQLWQGILRNLADHVAARDHDTNPEASGF